MNSILFDIGATKIRIAYTENGEFFEEPIVFNTPKNYEEGKSIFKEKAESLAGGREIRTVVGGMSRNVENWNYESFKNDLGDLFQSQVILENDAAIVGLGEAMYGAGRGYKIVAYITVSTGVGGVRVIDGKVDKVAVGFEPGKQIIDIEGGEAQTLEELISGKALSKKTGKNPKEILDPNVWDEHARFLSYGLNNIIVEWSPEVVVLGGSMITGDPAIPINKTEQYLKDVLTIFPSIPPIKMSELKDFGGLYGALVLLKQN